MLDTNQVSSNRIQKETEAKLLVNEIIKIYSIAMLKEIKLIGNTFTAYTYSYSDNLENNTSLADLLAD